MVEAGGISEGGQATAAEDMDGAMAYCGSGGTGAGRMMGGGWEGAAQTHRQQKNEVVCKLFC